MRKPHLATLVLLCRKDRSQLGSHFHMFPLLSGTFGSCILYLQDYISSHHLRLTICTNQGHQDLGWCSWRSLPGKLHMCDLTGYTAKVKRHGNLCRSYTSGWIPRWNNGSWWKSVCPKNGSLLIDNRNNSITPSLPRYRCPHHLCHSIPLDSHPGADPTI